jgi:hypothetical protein
LQSSTVAYQFGISGPFWYAAGDSEGAYLTMASTGALAFRIISTVGNFGTIFVDQAYWQKAIAARPRSAAKGFLIGGLAWFAIPFALASQGNWTSATTGETTPLLIGNVVSISVGAAVVVIGSLFSPQNFNFDLMKQKILIVDDRIRSIKRDAKFTYRYAIALSLVLVVVWPLPLYFKGMYFHCLFIRSGLDWHLHGRV